MIDAGPFLQPKEALGGALAGEELAVALVDVRSDQPRALGIGARADHRGHPAHVRRQTGAVQVADMRLGGDQDLAAEVPAFLLRCELVFIMHPGGACGDVRLHDLEAVERPAEAGLGIGDDRREPVAGGAAFHMLDLVGALERGVDPLGELGPGIGGVERLIGIHLPGGVGVGRDLPAREVDRLQPGADHLHRLVARERTEGVDIILGPEQLPQLERAAAGERVLDRERTAQLGHVLDRIRTDDPVEAAGRGGDQIVEAHRHCRFLDSLCPIHRRS